MLRSQLAKVATVEQVTVYDQIDAVDHSSPVMDHLRRGEIHYVTLTSSNIARSLLKAFDETIRERVKAGDIRLVAISPETGKAVREMGYPVAAEATEFTSEGLIAALLKL